MDYFLRPKPAYYTIKRELRPYTVGMTRTDEATHPDALSAAVAVDTRLQVWATNSTLEAKAVRLEVATFDLGDPAATVRPFEDKEVVLEPNCATELVSAVLPGQATRTKLSDVPKSIVVCARLLEKGPNGAVLARYSNWCVGCEHPS